jgi:Na+/melibiose symporter-like transporter
MGVIADRTRTRRGHDRPYLLRGSIPLAVLGVLVFTTPSLSPHDKRICVCRFTRESKQLLAYPLALKRPA